MDVAPRAPDERRLALGVLLGIFAVLVLRNAWLSDDAYITLRSVDHFVEGRGLVWNEGHRVQAYTHPLWMFVMSAAYWVTGEDYFTLIALGTGVSLAAWAAASRWTLPGRDWLALLAFVPLLASRAFVDYATSGLENPLSHLLVALLAARVFAGIRDLDQLRSYGLLSALLMLNRLDYALLILPVGLAASWRLWREGCGLWPLLRTVLLAGAPFIAWELFSLLYYGIFVPNTALAKLGTGIPGDERWMQGVMYALTTLMRDPVLPLICGLGIAVGLRRDGTRGLASGVAAYLVYVLWIGGDFMMGRFFTVPAFASTLILARTLARIEARPSRRLAGALLASTALLALGSPRPTWSVPSSKKAPPGSKDERGIADEQAFWYPASGLLGRTLEAPGITSKYRDKGEAELPGGVSKRGSVGYLGYFADPSAHIVDWFALTDPLLARLPAKRAVPWRQGHFTRKIPEGYIASLEHGDNRIEDPKLAKMYDDIVLVTRGPLFSSERLAAIWRLNTKWRDSHERFASFRYPAKKKVKLADGGSKASSFGPSGLWISTGKRGEASRFVVELTGPAAYSISFRKKGKIRGEVEVSVFGKGGFESIEIELSEGARESGYDTIVILPLRGKKSTWRARRFSLE